MALQRVKHYIRRTVHEDGSSRQDVCTFNQMQASDVGGVCTENGLVIQRARMLIDKWNRLGQAGISPKYYYSLVEGE